MGAHPRWIRSDLAYANTQRTVDRQFLFKPDKATKNIIGACAARAQQTFPVKLYWLEYNINHEQEGIAAVSNSTEHLNNVVLFKQLFHRLLTEEFNRLLGREGALFSTPARTVPCLDNASLEQQCLYAITNPVKDGLVDRVVNWKGFSSYAQIAQGKDAVYHYFDRTAWHKRRKHQSIQAFSKSVRLKFTPLPSIAHLTPAKQQSYLRREVRLIEQACREARKREGKTVMPPKKLERTDPRSRPKTTPPKTPKPLCHCACSQLANEYKRLHREFIKAYAVASAYYRSGLHDTLFPQGSFRPPLILLAA